MGSITSSQISNRNFLSPVGFEFSITKHPKVSFFCNSVKLPDITLETLTQSTYLKDLDIASNKIQYGDLSIKFIIDEDMTNYIAIHNWITGIGFPETPEQYKNLITSENNINDPLLQFSDGTIKILNSNYRPNITVSFKDLYPVNLSPLDFNSTAGDIEYFTAAASFKYTIYNITSNV